MLKIVNFVVVARFEMVDTFGKVSLSPRVKMSIEQINRFFPLVAPFVHEFGAKDFEGFSVFSEKESAEKFIELFRMMYPNESKGIDFSIEEMKTILDVERWMNSPVE